MSFSAYDRKPWLKAYPEGVPEELPPPGGSMVDLFEASARRAPERDAVRYFDATLSYGELDDLANRFAALLAARGVGEGDRVAVYMQNNPQFLVAQYGAWKRGSIVVPINPMLKARELEYHLNDSGARALVALEGLYEGVAASVVRGTSVEHVLTTSELDFLPEGDLPAPCGRTEATPRGTEDLMEALRATEPDGAARVPVSPDDTAYLVYTSGTTGKPKGAVEKHLNIAYNAEVYRTWMQIGDEDSVFGVAPLFHITGLVGHAALAGAAGIPLVLLHRFEASEALRLIEKWRPTFTVGAITAFIALMNSPESEGRDLSSLEKCYSGGAPIAPSITEQFEEKFGVYIHNIYGLTESNSPTHATPLGARAPVDEGTGALSIGVPVPGCEARLVSVEDASEAVPVGESGEFAARGPMIFSGYWNKPEETERAFHDGYFLTGDVAVMDEDGWFYIVDRKKDMINVSGYKVWPREVEDVLYTHPDVKEAAVVGVPDEYRGESVRAFVALKEGDGVTEDDLISYAKERMADYKYPRSIRFLDEVPKTATGKFLRRELRDEAR
ncbi:AMP-binding protein [Rubrobacter marinus]|uniref:AMP-binding protein n=1 Tax=Rubrobacter marinus TaxID=2653852 RepID=A0A6G8Q099_9ACTN|nr:long-chain fatty acid--CoA ligase [Rubrobacter marinus]QIN79875.1 AMP-binding protein [Rubrobacter marinus]